MGLIGSNLNCVLISFYTPYFNKNTTLSYNYIYQLLYVDKYVKIFPGFCDFVIYVVFFIYNFFKRIIIICYIYVYIIAI